MAAELHRRMGHIEGRCKLCGAAEETVVHMLFHCTRARIVWFISPLELRTDGLQGELGCILVDIWDRLEPSKVCLFFYLLWQIWKARCSQTYGGKNQLPQLVVTLAMAMCDSAQKAKGT